MQERAQELYCQHAFNCLQILTCTSKLNFAYTGKLKQQELPDGADMQAACYTQLRMGGDAHIVYMPLRIFTIAYMEHFTGTLPRNSVLAMAFMALQ